MRRFSWVLLFLTACAQQPGKPDIPEYPIEKSSDKIGKNWPASKPFPAIRYPRVALLRLDSVYYKVNDISLETTVMNAGYANGLSFVDSLGKPTTKFYTRHVLTSDERRELDSVFVINDSSLTATACVPFYRDVLVFYNEHGRQVAQAQICFQCGETYLTPKPSARFDERNWTQLESLVHKIAAH